jgi:8-oxo-dGTP diphosphatase
MTVARDSGSAHDLTRASREWVDHLLVDLATTYGEFRVREQTWELDPESYAQFRRRYEAGHSGGAGVWVQHDGAVLMVRHEGEDCWSEPGGKVEPGESFPETARRETLEETGVTVDITGVLEVHPVTHVSTEDAIPIVSPIVIFTGAYRSGSPERTPGEIAEAAWREERPELLLYDALEQFPFPE